MENYSTMMAQTTRDIVGKHWIISEEEKMA